MIGDPKHSEILSSGVPDHFFGLAELCLMKASSGR